RDRSLSIAGRPAFEGTATIRPDRDHVGIVDLAIPTGHEGEAATVEAAGMVRHLILPPASDAREPFAFWFGSCNQPFDSDTSHTMSDSPRARIYPAALRVATARKARFGLLIGDQMYADEMPFVDIRAWAEEHPEVSDATLLDIYRQLYRGYFNQSGIRGLLEAMPSHLIWDDHEIFNSWGSHLEVSDLDERVRRAAFAAYAEYQHPHNPGSSLDDSPPYHYHFWYASTGFFVFDLRGERDYRQERVIGETQWRAFAAFLEEATARGVESVFAVTSIPLVHFSPRLVQLLDRIPGHEGDNVRDRWDATAIASERDRLMDLLFDWQGASVTRNAIVLSGDVHAAAAFTVTRLDDRAGQFAQWTSSALSSPGGVAHTLANRLATRAVNVGDTLHHATRHGVEPRNNFGLVSVQPRESGRGHRLTLSIYGYDSRRNRLRRSINTTLD
ncbi:MAG: alkaline phosphatase D family protein, partial [Tepidiformaceae bacterium]